MYRQYEQEQDDNEERGTQAMGSPYTDKEDNYDFEKMENMQMPCINAMGAGIKMNIGGRPMMCYPIMSDEPTLYEQNDDSFEGMHKMGCPGMQFNQDMYRQPQNYYENRPNYHPGYPGYPNYPNHPNYPNYPMKPFFPYIWYNFYPFHMPYPPHHPYNEREDWY